MGTNNREYKKYGYIDFSKLWVMLKKKKLNKQYLLNNGIHKTSLYKLVNNENVTCEVIAKLCYILDTQPGKFMEYIPVPERSAEDPQKIRTETEAPFSDTPEE